MILTISKNELAKDVLTKNILKIREWNKPIDKLAYDLRMVNYSINGKTITGFHHVNFQEKKNNIYLSISAILNIDAKIYSIDGDEFALIWNVKCEDGCVSMEINDDIAGNYEAFINKESEHLHILSIDVLRRHFKKMENKGDKKKLESAKTEQKPSQKNTEFLEVKKAFVDYLLENGFKFKKKSGKDVERFSKMEMVGGRLYHIRIRFTQNEIMKTYSFMEEGCKRVGKLTFNLGMFQTNLKTGDKVANYEQIKRFMSILE